MRTAIACLYLTCLNSVVLHNLTAQEAQEVVPVVVEGNNQQLAFAFTRVKDLLNPVDLSKLVHAKFNREGDQLSLIFLVEQYRTEERTTQVMEMRPEKRTRKVLVEKDGRQQEVEREFTINVAVSSEKTGPVRIPVGKKPVQVPLDQVKVYRLDATPVSPQELEKQLAKMQPVFLARPTDQELKPTSDIVRQALSPHLLIVLTDAIAL